MGSHEYGFSRTLPISISLDSILQTLHRHQEIIELSPFVQEFRVQPCSSPSTESFEIFDKINYLPFGIFSGTVSVKAVFSDRADGVSVVRNAPLGITMHEDWLVRPIKPTTEHIEGANELILNVKMTGNRAILALFKGTMEKNHERIYLDGIIERLSRKNRP